MKESKEKGIGRTTVFPREKWISTRGSFTIVPDPELELKPNSLQKGFKPENNHRDSIARRGRSILNKSAAIFDGKRRKEFEVSSRKRGYLVSFSQLRPENLYFQSNSVL